MPLDKLTERAKLLIRDLSIPEDTGTSVKRGRGRPKKTEAAVVSSKKSSKKIQYKPVSSLEILSYLYETGGLSTVLLRSFPNLEISNKKDIDLDILVKEAFFQASSMDHTYVGTEHLLLALVKLTTPKQLKPLKDHLLGLNLFPRALDLINDRKENVILDTFGKDLNKTLFKTQQDPLLKRDELNSIISILLKRDTPNVLLVGENGVGKESLVHLLVNSITSLEIPTVLAGYHIVEFDLMAYMTSLSNKGSIEQNLATLQEELKGLRRSILLLKNFQSMFIPTNAGFGVPVFLPIVKDLIEETGISIIATMNAPIYEKLAVDNSHILDSFTVVEVPEPTEEQTLKMMSLKAESLADFHNIKISDQVIRYIYETAKINEFGSSFPQKGIDLLDLACANLLVRKNRVPEEYKSLVDSTIQMMDDVNNLLEKGDYTGAEKLQKKIERAEDKLTMHENTMIYGSAIKLNKTDVDLALTDLDFKLLVKPVETDNLVDLASKVKSLIIGQDEAVDSVVKALIRARLGLRDKKRPIGNFLFLGPTGVGKTELAKVLAGLAFGDGDGAGSGSTGVVYGIGNGSKGGKNKPLATSSLTRKHLIRLDMSDFSEKHTVARLIGSPPGYVGYNEGGELTSKIDARPDSVVLFDEIEKAHPDVLNILLQITEEGELSDAKGNTFDFSQAIIILTSNLGTEILHNSEIGFTDSINVANDKVVEGHLKNNLKKILKPELLNRFDEVIVFRRLSKDDQMSILDLLLNEVDMRLREQNVFLTVTKKAKEYLLNAGHSTEYGARSLRRVIERELLDKVAELLLEIRGRSGDAKGKEEDSENGISASLNSSKLVFLKTYISDNGFEVRVKN